MPGAQLFLDFIKYPKLRNAVSGQRINITIGGIAKVGRDGVNLTIESLDVGKRSKMSTQAIMLANRLDRIEAKLPGQATAV